MQRRYKGVFPVVPTTFHDDGSLDLESQKRCLDFMIDAGSNGLCILANFSEQFSLSDAERETLEEQCTRKGMRMTDQRRTIAQVMEQALDHPDVEELYRRASAIDPRISLSTVYRTLNLFEEAGLVTKHDFRDGRARFEPIPDEHHDHLIDIRTGRVIEFRNEEIEAIQEVIAKRLGYRLVDHRMELYGVRLSRND